MEKTTVYLTTEQKAALAEAARQQGRSEARLIRDGVEGVLSGHRTREAAASLAWDPTAGSALSDERPARPRWMNRETFVRELLPVQADAAMRADLRGLAPDMLDEALEP